MAKILLAEDDEDLASKVRLALNHQKHLVEWVNDGRKASDLLSAFSFDLIIMDWEMPQMTGPEVVKAFRSRGMHTPILMLTGKATLDDKETGFGAGADDYLTKPFALKELILRIDALLRRPHQVIPAILQAGELSLDPKARVVRVGERTVHLEPMEFGLLEFFVKYPNEAFTYDALLNRVWSSDSDASEDTVRTCVKKLRRKISEDPNNSPIETVHRIGYRFRL